MRASRRVHRRLEAGDEQEQRGADDLGRRLDELAAADDERPLPGTTPVEAWTTSHALLVGLQLDRWIAPELLTPAVFARACELLAGLYPEP
ncbi:MAG: hypothetical protein ACRDOK_18580 [Streptosporangiaceae bacterium]